MTQSRRCAANPPTTSPADTFYTPIHMQLFGMPAANGKRPEAPPDVQVAWNMPVATCAGAASRLQASNACCFKRACRSSCSAQRRGIVHKAWSEVACGCRHLRTRAHATCAPMYLDVGHGASNGGPLPCDTTAMLSTLRQLRAHLHAPDSMPAGAHLSNTLPQGHSEHRGLATSAQCDRVPGSTLARCSCDTAASASTGSTGQKSCMPTIGGRPRPHTQPPHRTRHTSTRHAITEYRTDQSPLRPR